MNAQETLARFEASVVEYRGTIRTFARNSVRQLPSMDIEDIEQELLMVLWKCVQNYDPSRGASFNTLFQGSAKNKIIGLIRHYSTKKRNGDYLLTSINTDEMSAVIESMHKDGSAEDWYLALSEHGEKLSQEMKRGA